jgi:hypothetical protein
MTEESSWVKVELKFSARDVAGIIEIYRKYMDWLDSNKISRHPASKGVGFADHVNLLPEDAVAFKLKFGL